MAAADATLTEPAEETGRGADAGRSLSRVTQVTEVQHGEELVGRGASGRLTHLLLFVVEI